MYDARRVRQLCEEIAIEQDDEKAQDLIELLGAVMRGKKRRNRLSFGSSPQQVFSYV